LYSSGHEEYRFAFPIGSDHLHVSVYFGPKPQFGLGTREEPRYGVRGGPPVDIKVDYFQDATQSDHPRNFFTEIICWSVVDIAPELAEAFHQDEPAAKKELVQLALGCADISRAAVDMAVGTVGLKLHRQLVIKPLNDNVLAYDEQRFALEFYGNAIELLDPQELDEQSILALAEPLSIIAKKQDDTLQTEALVFDWLARAWDEHEPVSKFLALFIPLEMILKEYGADEKKKQELLHQAQSMRDLVVSHAGELQQQLLAFFNRLFSNQNPSLAERFEQLARKAALPNWETDVTAFKRFNKIRNALVHSGDKASIRLLMQLSEDEVASLEDITERYVNYHFFKDAQVYNHRYRPRHRQGEETLEEALAASENGQGDTDE
jgi:hypothetical protein